VDRKRSRKGSVAATWKIVGFYGATGVVEQPFRQLTLKKSSELASCFRFVVTWDPEKVTVHVAERMISATEFVHKPFKIVHGDWSKSLVCCYNAVVQFLFLGSDHTESLRIELGGGYIQAEPISWMRVETVAKRALLMSWEKRMDEARIARWCGLSFDALFVERQSPANQSGTRAIRAPS
jgi:hypothetical protein